MFGFIPTQKLATPTTNGSMVSGYLQYTGSKGPGLVCAGELDRRDAQVVCATTTEMFLHDMTEVALSDITTNYNVFYRGSSQCTGDETDITECSVILQTATQCPRGLIQRITCTPCEYGLHVHVCMLCTPFNFDGNCAHEPLLNSTKVENLLTHVPQYYNITCGCGYTCHRLLCKDDMDTPPLSLLVV